MPRSAESYREEFEEQGYVVFEGVLSPAEAAEARARIDRLIPPDAQPPLVTGDIKERNGRKQLAGKYCEPWLANLAGHPRMIEAVGALMRRPFRITHTSTPAVTYKSPPGAERFDFGYHVDWPHTPPEPGDETCINGVLHLAAVEPGGGAFMVCPGSHRMIERVLGQPELRERAFKQKFEGFPGLPEPKEMCVPEGAALFYHAFLVHDRSENLRDQPRRVVFCHYKAYFDEADRARVRAEGAKRFHADQLAAMDGRMRALCGLE